MHTTGKQGRQFRYRAYFWLINASFFAIVYSFVELLIGSITGFDLEDYMPGVAVAFVYAPIAAFMFLVPMFLICARFMRDEYAEQLWRRTSVVLAYATAGIPLLCFILGWIWYFATGHTDAQLVHWSLRWMAEDVKWGDAVMGVWLGYMMVFVVIFQFLRWRDSR